MSKVLKTALTATFCAVTAAVLVLCYIGGGKEDGRILCSRVRVTVSDSLENDFVTPKSIQDLIRKEYGDVIGRAVDSLDINAIENIVNDCDAVKSACVWAGRDSVLNILVEQKKPFAMFQGENVGFYIDRNGEIFPLQSGHPSNVMKVGGVIPVNVGKDFCGVPENACEREWLGKMISLLEYMENNPQWLKVIGKIQVDGKSDVTLYPIKGKEKFLLGQPDGVEGKFDRILHYYTSVLPARGRDFYTSVDVRFDRQIVCKK